jgi:Ca2+-transporting ATPase
MGVDPQSDDVMARPPRRPQDRDHRRADVVRRAAGRAGDGARDPADAWTSTCPVASSSASHDLDTARTAAFTTLVFAQLFNCFNARSESASAFHGLFHNPWLWGSVALAVLLQVAVVHLPAGNIAFGTAPLAPDEWLA